MKRPLIKYKRQTLTQVKAEIKSKGYWGGTVVPCNLRPDSELAIRDVRFTAEDMEPSPDHKDGRFLDWMNQFGYYNLSKQNGYYAAFYKQIIDLSKPPLSRSGDSK